MTKKDVQEWIEQTEKLGYIDCAEFWDEEFKFIIEIAKELLKRMEE